MKIRPDHFKHLIAGYGITVISSAILIQLLPSLPTALLGFLAGALVGAGKEIVWDKWMGRGTPEMSDFWWTVIGSGAGVLPQLINFII